MKTIRFISVWSLLAAMVLLASPVFAQQESAYHTINGVVKDARSKRPIPFASVFVPGTSVGTVANLDGVFTLKIQKSLNANQIAISHLGYRIKQFPIGQHLGQGQEFLLDTYSVSLQEVVVRPRDARELVMGAINRININYPVVPQRLTGFYREGIKQRRDYISISEAVVDVYQAPYNALTDTDRVKIIQGRKSADVKKVDTLLVKLQGGPHVSLMLDIVKNPNVLLSRESIAYYNYELVDIVKIDDESNYVIEFKPRVVLPYPLFYGRLYISISDLAITMAEFSLDLTDKDKAAQNFVLRKPLRLRFTPTNTNYLVTYKKIDGKYQVNYVRTEIEFFADWRARIFRTGYTVMAEMAITDREQGAVVERFSGRDVFRPTGILADMVPTYFDEAFWGDYNVIEPDESIESAIRKLNRRFER